MKQIDIGHVAIMNIQYKYYPLSLFLDDAVKNEVENIELWGGAPHFYQKDMTCGQIRNLRREIQERGLNLVCFTPEQCVYPVNLAAASPEARRRSLQYFEDSIRVASELGSKKMLVTSGTGYFDGSDHEEAWKWAAQNLYELGETAEAEGITLVLEVLRRDESNLIYNLSTLKAMLETLNHPAICGMLDTIPMALAGESPAMYLRELGERLAHVHFVDGAPRGHLAWGDGVLDMEEYLKELDEGGYRGFLSLEITDGRYFMEPSVSVAKSIRRLRMALEG